MYINEIYISIYNTWSLKLTKTREVKVKKNNREFSIIRKSCFTHVYVSSK